MLEQALRQQLEINGAEIDVRTDRREIAVVDACEQHVITVLPGIEVVEHETIWGINHPRLLSSKGSAVSRDQPELRLTIGLRDQALGSTLLTHHVGQRIESDGVLKKHRPVGGDREVVQKGEAVEAVAALAQQIARLHPLGRVILHRKLHQPHGATGPGLDPEGDHPGRTVVARVKARVGAEGFTFLEQAAQPAEAAGFQGLGIERMGLGRLPQGQQLIAQAHHVGVGDVLEPQVKGIGGGATRLLGAEHAPVKETIGLLFGQPAFGAHKPVAQHRLAVRKRKGRDHAVAVKRVVHPLATPLKPPRPVAVQGAAQLGRNRAPCGGEFDPIELNADIAKGASPVGPVITRNNAGGDGHGTQKEDRPIIP